MAPSASEVPLNVAYASGTRRVAIGAVDAGARAPRAGNRREHHRPRERDEHVSAHEAGHRRRHSDRARNQSTAPFGHAPGGSGKGVLRRSYGC